MSGTPHSQAPLVSIGVPVYNEEDNLAATLDSLLAQDYPYTEVIVCDNASSDGTAELARAYASADPRVSFHRATSNVGASDNFNWAFRLSSGRYFTWASGHDTRALGAISACVDYLEARPDAVLCYPRSLIMAHDGRTREVDSDTVETMGLPPSRRLRTVTATLTMCNAVHGVIRTSALARTRLFRRCLGSDYVLLAELSLIGGFHQLDQPWFVRREIRAPEAADRMRVERTLGDLAVTDAHALRRPYRAMCFEYLAGVRHTVDSTGRPTIVVRSAGWCARRWWRPLLVETFPRFAARAREIAGRAGA